MTVLTVANHDIKRALQTIILISICPFELKKSFFSYVPFENSLQLCSELFVDEQVDEEVGQVVDKERELKVAADCGSSKDCVV